MLSTSFQSSPIVEENYRQVIVKSRSECKGRNFKGSRRLRSQKGPEQRTEDGKGFVERPTTKLEDCTIQSMDNKQEQRGKQEPLNEKFREKIVKSPNTPPLSLFTYTKYYMCSVKYVKVP